MRNAVVALSIAVLLGAAPTPAPITPEREAALDRALASMAGTKQGESPALSVAVVEDGGLAYVRAFGNAGPAAAATTQTRFRIASVTKMFTAVSVMQLAQAGRLRLDASLATYLPAAPHAGEITIRELLMHTSGLWNYGDQAFSDGSVAAPTTPSAIVALAAAHPLTNRPGTAFAYSNTGYVLLGQLVEALAHQPLAAYERDHIFAPAGMTQTAAGEPPADAPMARGYMSATGTVPPPYSASWLYADGDIVSTARDVALFDAALMDGKLLTPRTFAEMQSSSIAAPELGPGVRYGLGVMLVASGGATFVGHHGGTPGYEAETEMIPSERFAMVVLSNAYDFPTAAANVALLRQTLPAVVAAAAPSSAQPAANDDPAIAARLRAFITGLQQGSVDPARLSPRVQQALTPAAIAQVRAMLAPLGALGELTFRGRDTVQGDTVYHYVASFASGKQLPITFVLDANGLVDGFFFA